MSCPKQINTSCFFLLISVLFITNGTIKCLPKAHFWRATLGGLTGLLIVCCSLTSLCGVGWLEHWTFRGEHPVSNLCCCVKPWADSFSLRYFSSLSCRNKNLIVDSGGCLCMKGLCVQNAYYQRSRDQRRKRLNTTLCKTTWYLYCWQDMMQMMSMLSSSSWSDRQEGLLLLQNQLSCNRAFKSVQHQSFSFFILAL